MNGLSLSRGYFNSIALPSLTEEFPDLPPRLAAGLAGNGSECFGYDDEISRDHDWGVDFFVWVTDGDADRIPDLRAWKTKNSAGAVTQIMFAKRVPNAGVSHPK